MIFFLVERFIILNTHRNVFDARCIIDSFIRHQFLGGGYKHAFNAALLVTVMTTGMSFYLCNKDHDNKRDVMKKAFDKSNIKEAK